MPLPTFKEQSEQPSGSAFHAGVQTIAAVVVALAAVFAATKDNLKLVWALVVLTVIGGIWTVRSRPITLVQNWKVRRLRNKAAVAKHEELLRFAKRFAPFTNSGVPNNLWYIIHSSCANDPDKADALCPPDYMRDVFPPFAQHLETRPPENETQFLLAAQELYALIASYNKEYVIEPFRRMRLTQWVLPPTDLGTAQPKHPSLGTWLDSLPAQYRKSAETHIEDFRERWAGLLDAMTEWLENVNESFGTNIPIYFERPKKL